MREIFFDSLKPFPSGHHENLKNKNASTSNAKIQIHTTRERERGPFSPATKSRKRGGDILPPNNEDTHNAIWAIASEGKMLLFLNV